MKIAIIATFLGQKTSGAEISSFHLAKNLKDKHQVFAITTKITQKMPFKCYSLPKLNKIPNLVILIGHRLIDNYMKKQITKILKKENPDIIHIQDSSMMIAAVKAARNIPTIFTVRDYRFTSNLSIPLEEGYVPFKYSKKTYQKWLYQSFHQAYGKGWISYFMFNWFYTQNNRLIKYFKKIGNYITVADFVKEQVIKSGIDKNRIRTIKVQKENWEPTINKTTHQIFTAGGLKKTKGFDYLIKSFKEVARKYPQVKLRIAGEGSEKERLIKIMRGLGLTNNIVFLEQISHEQMKNEYEQADFVISPSLWPEPLTRIIFETFSMQRTIVSTNVGGSSELVHHNKTGLLVKPKNITEMSSAILKLIENPKLRDKLAKNAHQIISSQCSNKINYQKHLQFYKDLTARSK